MKLFVENYHGLAQLEILTESMANGGKRMYLEGPMVMCNAPNRNRRLYDKDTVGIPSVAAYNRDYIMDSRAIGEIEHPTYPFPKLSEAATMIKDPLNWVGNDAVGKALILNNQKGQILTSLVEAGYNMGVSTRGLGATVKSGQLEKVKPGYMITAVDTVDRPSGQTCYVKAITEATEWVEKDGVWMPLDIKGNDVDRIVNENADDEEFIRRFKKALNKLG